MASHGDTPHWQLVQKCSVVRANHGRAQSLSHRSEEVEAFVEFMFPSHKKSLSEPTSQQSFSENQ